MTETAYIIFIAVVALSLASMTVRGVVKYRGPELVVYLVAVVLCAVMGAVIAAAIDEDHVALGIACGVGLVEAAPTITGAFKKRAKRLGDGE